MLKFKLREMLQASGKKYPYKWLMMYCGFGKHKSYKYLNGQQDSFSLTDLSHLCEGLRCTPNDLLYWEQSSRLMLDQNHPIIQELTTPSQRSDWYKLLNTLTPNKLARLHQMIENGEIILDEPDHIQPTP